VKQEDEPSHVKITFSTEDAVETMWAIHREDGTYEIDNSPFEAYGISYRDVVAAHVEDGMLVFNYVIRRGGHSTYRVKLYPGAEHDQFIKYWPQLALLGCTYEGAGGARRLYSIDVPTHAAVGAVYAHLQSVEGNGAWEFEEAHYFAPEQP
jgi:hypothetical protein